MCLIIPNYSTFFAICQVSYKNFVHLPRGARCQGADAQKASD